MLYALSGPPQPMYSSVDGSGIRATTSGLQLDTQWKAFSLQLATTETNAE